MTAVDVTKAVTRERMTHVLAAPDHHAAARRVLGLPDDAPDAQFEAVLTRLDGSNTWRQRPAGPHTLKARPFHWVCKRCNKNGYRFSVITRAWWSR